MLPRPDYGPIRRAAFQREDILRVKLGGSVPSRDSKKAAFCKILQRVNEVLVFSFSPAGRENPSGGALPPRSGGVLSAVRCHRRIDAAFRPGAQTCPRLPLPRERHDVLAPAPCPRGRRTGFSRSGRFAPGASSAYGRAAPLNVMVRMGLGVLRPRARLSKGAGSR